MAAASTRRRTRINSKIERLPPEVKCEVDKMLADPCYTYTEIAQWLQGQEYEVSRGAVGRYALRVNEAARRVADNLQRTRAIVEMVERHPELDPAKASQALMMDGLMQRLSSADEDWQEMPLDDAGRLIAAFRRVDLADRKLQLETRRKIELAFAGLEEQLLATVKADPELSRKMRDLLVEAKDQLLKEDG